MCLVGVIYPAGAGEVGQRRKPGHSATWKQLVGSKMFVLLCIFVCASVATPGKVMTGQPREVSVNNREVLAAARFAVDEFNRVKAEDQLAYKIVNITSAKIQVRLHI